MVGASLGDMRMADMARRRWGEEPLATARERRQEQDKARMPRSRFPFMFTGSSGLVHS